MFLLDTNVVSELRKVGDGKADANVVGRLSSMDAKTFYVSVVTVMELEFGILRLERRDASRGARLRRWMDNQILPEFSGRILAVDTDIALRCARLHVPNARPDSDAYIAATALVHGMTVVTRNLADFAPMGVAVLNPWESFR